MLTLISSSPLHTIQDRGRLGLSRYGLASAGPMDAHASAWANKLLGNSPEAAQIEICSGGFTARFDAPCRFSITGANCTITLDGEPLDLWTTQFAETGSRLEIGACQSGLFTYLAIGGGLDLPAMLGSRSQSRRDGIGGLDGKACPLKAGDQIPYTIQTTARTARQRTPQQFIPDYNTPLVCDLMFRASNIVSDEVKQHFIEQEYQVAKEVSRIGYRLEGEAIPVTVPRYSAPIPLGGVQITAAGQPVVLMRDHQTLGGYPIIATVTRKSLGMLAQRRPGQPVSFRAVEVAQARHQLEELRNFFGDFR